MLQNACPIGVIDSGVGGLTVVRQLQRILPGEDLLYFGDSANCPYGNRSADEIFSLTMRMLRHLERCGVKCAAIACNTISTIVDRLRPECPFPLISIVEAGADYVVRQKLNRVGLVATEFTISTGAYEERIHAANPDCFVSAKGSPDLAALIDRGDLNRAVINEKVTEMVDVVLSRGEIKDLILGCTHFPIIEENFRACFPELRLIDPAEQQAAAVKNLLVYRKLSNPRTRGTLTIQTSGEAEVYEKFAALLSLRDPDACTTVTLS